LLGKTVFTKKGTVLGKVFDIELDDHTWTPVTLYVELSDEVAKTYGVKSGVMKKTVIPLPGKMMGTIGDAVMLNEEITDINELRSHATTTSAIF
jgi:sporulation protein YlmC with PRC-barrel domain